MKTKIKKLFNFCCMVVVLGTQALLEGSWKVEHQEHGKIES